MIESSLVIGREEFNLREEVLILKFVIYILVMKIKWFIFIYSGYILRYLVVVLNCELYI